LSQKLISDKDPLKLSLQYSERVRIITVFDNSAGLFQAGEDISRIWENYRNVKGNFHDQSVTVFQRWDLSCSPVGNGRSDFPDRFFSEFIRSYWDCPNGD
jgi:hypothetical protein